MHDWFGHSVLSSSIATCTCNPLMLTNSHAADLCVTLTNYTQTDITRINNIQGCSFVISLCVQVLHLTLYFTAFTGIQLYSLFMARHCAYCSKFPLFFKYMSKLRFFSCFKCKVSTGEYACKIRL